MALIHFRREATRVTYILKLGPTDVHDPPERAFEGGDEVRVRMQTNDWNPNCVDLTFEDGEFAIAISREYFDIVDNGATPFA